MPHKHSLRASVQRLDRAISRGFVARKLPAGGPVLSPWLRAATNDTELDIKVPAFLARRVQQIVLSLRLQSDHCTMLNKNVANAWESACEVYSAGLITYTGLCEAQAAHTRAASAKHHSLGRPFTTLTRPDKVAVENHDNTNMLELSVVENHDIIAPRFRKYRQNDQAMSSKDPQVGLVLQRFETDKTAPDFSEAHPAVRTFSAGAEEFHMPGEVPDAIRHFWRSRGLQATLSSDGTLQLSDLPVREDQAFAREVQAVLHEFQGQPSAAWTQIAADTLDWCPGCEGRTIWCGRCKKCTECTCVCSETHSSASLAPSVSMTAPATLAGAFSAVQRGVEDMAMQAVTADDVQQAVSAAVSKAVEANASRIESQITAPLEGQLQRLAARVDVIEAERRAAALDAYANVGPPPPEEEYDPDDDLADDELDLLEELGLDVSMVRRGRKEKEAAKEQSGT